jgi:hypothetical protein
MNKTDHSLSSTFTWKQTRIWSELANKRTPEADSVRATLETCMPDIEKVLATGGTAPLDFTLHDAGHASRVAERMAEIIPPDVFPELSTYELALLLLSAYLHDIGMTPEHGKVHTVYTFLLTNDPQDLPESEKRLFEKWLDENRPGIAPPISDPNNPQSYRTANEITAYYCRNRHVDWGEQWIREHLARVRLGTYDSWMDDLVTLCRSHHEGYNELRRDRFNPRHVGAPPAMVHLRYLAVALRVADVLEFDPERTPDVILRHRNISSASLIYWWKDQAMSMKLEGPRIVISARPRSAQIHKAIETTIRDINAELSLSRRLADETRFQTCPGLAADLPHRWDLLPASHHDIQPRDESYVYIDGAFRPDTQKLLQLLSGVELYGDELVAVRELLQNAFDAVREKIAYERLNSPDAANPSLENTLSTLNRVDLRLEVTDDGAWLVCADTGVGMTKALIQDHLLVSGVASRHDVLELERRCGRAGFRLGRTGQFGIGVLSYFMLADRVVIRTRRSQEPGDTDNEGWNFETEGVGSFGELRRDSSIARGTEVRLHLRQDTIGKSVVDWYRRLLAYLRTELSRIPCAFSLRASISSGASLDLKPGFTYDYADLADSIGERLGQKYQTGRETPVQMLPKKRREELEAEERYWITVRQEMYEQLRWKTKEGDLPHNLGTFRIHIPYFDLPGGPALAFLRPRQQDGILNLERVGKGYSYIPKPEAMFSWKGMRVHSGREVHYQWSTRRYFWQTRPASIVEADWVSAEAGTIAVSRHGIELSDKALTSLDWLSEQVIEMGRHFLTNARDSVYSLLNSRLMERESEEGIKPNWISVNSNSKVRRATWEELRVPLISVLSVKYSFRPEIEAKWNSRPLAIVRCLGDEDDADPYKGLAWHATNVRPDRICARVGVDTPSLYSFGLSPVWTEKLSAARPTHSAGLTCRFPPRWNHISGAQFESYANQYTPATIWNPENIVVLAVTPEGWTWCTANFKESLDPLPVRGSLLIEKARAASWILMCLQAEQVDIWNGLSDRDSSFLPAVWSIVFGAEASSQTGPEVLQWVEASIDPRLRSLTPGGWGAYRLRDKETKVEKYLPDPGADWTVTLDDEGSKQLRKQFRNRSSRAAPKSTKP